MRRTARILVAPLLATVLLPGCSAEPPWREALLEHRQQKDEQYRTSDRSPMAGVQYLKSEPAAEVYLTLRDDVFGLDYVASRDAVARFARQNDAWRWTALSDELVAEGAATSGPAQFGLGRFRLSFYPSDERVTLIVFDPQRPEMRSFEQLVYFAPDRKYAVDARLERFPEAQPVTMLTSRNLEKTFYRYAKIRFRLDGEEQELTAFKYWLTGENSAILFIPFRDATSGKESYGAGRFLEIEEPAKEAFVLDFNRSFNPLCNYSPAYNCAIPPRENHLDVAIRAGEKSYPTRTPH